MTPDQSIPLPTRRKSVTYDLQWRADPSEPGFHFTLGIGRGPDGMPCEVFCTGPKAGSMLLTILDDFCVGVSRLHQNDGISFTALAERMRADIDPVSPLGLIMRTVAKCEDCPICLGEKVLGVLVSPLSGEVMEQPCPACAADAPGSESA